MGAVPGGSLLSAPGACRAPGALDVEAFRAAGRRVVLREVDRPLVVLGSRQPCSVVDEDRARRHGVSLVHRRSGGGAVLVSPGAQVWADMWVPRDDPLWSVEPRASAVAAGEWWARALGAAAFSGSHEVLDVRRGAPVPGAGSDVVCFAGVAPGEVVWEGRKVVGLAQWRSREGALVHGCAYRRWDPEPLVGLLDLSPAARHALLAPLRDAAVGFEELGARPPSRDQLLAGLVGALPDPSSWELVRE